MAITLTYIGADEWDRAVFKGDNGRFYKTVGLEPRSGFGSLPQEEKLEYLKSLYTTDEPDGDPGFPCWNADKFSLDAS